MKQQLYPALDPQVLRDVVRSVDVRLEGSSWAGRGRRSRAVDPSELPLLVPKAVYEQICSEAGVSFNGVLNKGLPRLRVVVTAELKAHIERIGMIYGSEGVLDQHYYLEMAENGAVRCGYQTIIGGRDLGTMPEEWIKDLVSLAAKRLLDAIPDELMPGLALKTDGSGPVLLDEELRSQMSMLLPEGDRLVLPAVELSRYQSIKKVLENAGARYERGGRFRFRPGVVAEDVLRRLLDGEKLNERQQTQFFPTPSVEADALCAMAGPLGGKRICDPSAGHGALIDAALRAGAGEVVAIENWEPNAEVLRRKGYKTIEADFLRVRPEQTGLFDALIMNPPFSNGQDLEHLRHAMSFAKPTGSVTAIVSTSYQFRQTRSAVGFRELLEVAGVEPCALPEGAFRSAGTSVSTVRMHFDLPDLRRRLRETGREASEFGLQLAEPAQADDDALELADPALQREVARP